jgi:hypothetical protein
MDYARKSLISLNAVATIDKACLRMNRQLAIAIVSK